MIKNRHFMLGLGFGLIIGALLLQLMMIGQRTVGGLYTKEEVQKAATRIGLKVVETDQELLTKEEWQAKEKDGSGGQSGAEPKETENPSTPSDPKKPATPVKPTQPSSKGSKPAAKAEPSGASTPTAPEKPKATSVEYKIAYGSTLAGVAEGLYESGVIKDKDAFLQEAKSKKINYKVRTGTYSFKVGEEFSSIISKISPKGSNK